MQQQLDGRSFTLLLFFLETRNGLSLTLSTVAAQVKLKDFDVEVHVWVHNTTAVMGLTLPRAQLAPSLTSLNHRVLTTLRPSV